MIDTNKRDEIIVSAEGRGLRVFIETGTFHGDMIEAVGGSFDALFSIELDAGLYAECANRFRDRSDVQLLHGDSGALMADLLREIHEPALFWLDGHDSGSGTARGTNTTPVLEELVSIFSDPIQAKQCVILIDDARLFDGTNGWPTQAEIRNFADFNDRDFEVANDIIRIF